MWKLWKARRCPPSTEAAPPRRRAMHDSADELAWPIHELNAQRERRCKMAVSALRPSCRKRRTCQTCDDHELIARWLCQRLQVHRPWRRMNRSYTKVCQRRSAGAGLRWHHSLSAKWIRVWLVRQSTRLLHQRRKARARQATRASMNSLRHPSETRRRSSQPLACCRSACQPARRYKSCARIWAWPHSAALTSESQPRMSSLRWRRQRASSPARCRRSSTMRADESCMLKRSCSS